MEELIAEEKNNTYHLQSHYNKEFSYIEFVISGTFHLDLALKGQRATLDFIKENPVKCVFYDLNNLKGTFTHTDHTNFVKSEYIPALVNAGVTDLTALISKDPFTIFAVNVVTKFIKQPKMHIVRKEEEYHEIKHKLIESFQ